MPHWPQGKMTAEGPEALGSKIVASLIKSLIAGDSSGAALAPKAKWPPRASGSLGLHHRCFLNKRFIIAGDHSGAALAPDAKWPPRAFGGLALQNCIFVNEALKGEGPF